MKATFTGILCAFAICFASNVLSQTTDVSGLLSSAKKKHQAGDITGALSDYSQAIKANPNSEEAFYERGRIYSEQKKYLEAISDFTKAITINGKHYRAYYLRGYTKYMMGNYRDAVSDFDFSIELHPNSALALWYRAESKMKLGDINGACADWDAAYRLGYFEAAAKTKVNCQNIALSTKVTADKYLKSGDMKLDKGDATGALVEYQKAYELDQQSGIILYSIGLAKIILKDKSGACEAWKKAIEIGSPEAEELIKQHCN
jgi:tetratricopeptide (TPR) repeat protein